MRSGVPPDAVKAQESLLEAVVVILEARNCRPKPSRHKAAAASSQWQLGNGARRQLDVKHRQELADQQVVADEAR